MLALKFFFTQVFAPVRNYKGALATLLFGLAASVAGQEQVDKSAPNDRNTDLRFDFSVTNTGRLGTYRIVRLDTGETLATGLVGRDVSPRTTLLNEFKAAGLSVRTPLAIQIEGANGSWSTVDSIEVHYPPEPSDSQRYLDDAGYEEPSRYPIFTHHLQRLHPLPLPLLASATPPPSPALSGSPG